MLVALDAILAPGAPLLEEEGGVDGLGFISSAGLSLPNRNKLQANQYATCSICS